MGTMFMRLLWRQGFPFSFFNPVFAVRGTWSVMRTLWSQGLVSITIAACAALIGTTLVVFAYEALHKNDEQAGYKRFALFRESLSSSPGVLLVTPSHDRSLACCLYRRRPC